MERKSIGTFIAALRRANGMTQKDLAERLSVSDKAVSRWERDESLPDMMLLPVIADIFHITADELLRGERKAEAIDSSYEVLDSAAESARLKKQTKRMLSLQLNKLRGHYCIVFCAAAVGLIAALVCNFGLSRGFVGFCVGTVCVIVAAVMTVVFTQDAWQAADDEELDPGSVNHFRIQVIKWCKWVLIGLTAALSLCLPMALAALGNAQGFAETFIDAGEWSKYSAIVLSVLSTALSAAFYYVNKRLLSTRYAQKAKQNRLHGWCVTVLCCVMVLTLIGMAMVPEIAQIARRDGMRFNNVDDFVAEMERRWTEQENNGSYQSWTGTAVEYIGTYYDTQGSEISREDAALEEIYDLDGNVIAEYHCPYDTHVVTTYYSDDEISIVCYTDSDLRSASFERENRINLLMLAFVLEPLLAAGAYLLLRKES